MNYNFELTDAFYNKFVSYYHNFIEENTDSRILYSFKSPDFKIIIYNSKKVMFQGNNGYEEYQKWAELMGLDVIHKPTVLTETFPQYNHKKIIGSDEVGTGDFFGPMVICAAYVGPKEESLLESLNIQDSKALSDKQIIETVPKLIDVIGHHVLVLQPEKFNALTQEGYNMNKLKAYLHNHAIKKLVNQFPNYDYVIIDEFCSPKNYFDYLKTEKAFTNIQFHTKAESVHKAVAVASMIARYKFLLEMDKLSESIHITLPKGAGAPADAVGKVIYLKHGKDIFTNIAKISFKNFNRIIK